MPQWKEISMKAKKLTAMIMALAMAVTMTGMTAMAEHPNVKIETEELDDEAYKTRFKTLSRGFP